MWQRLKFKHRAREHPRSTEIAVQEQVNEFVKNILRGGGGRLKDHQI